MHLPRIAPSDTGFRPLLLGILWRHRLLAAAVLVYGTVAAALTQAVQGPPPEGNAVMVLVGNFLEMLPRMAAVLLIWRLLVMRRTQPRAGQWAWLQADLRTALSDRERLLSGVVAAVLMAVVMISFSQLKRLIPVIQPFGWDETFIALDQMLHLGMDPWRIAHAVAGHPMALTFVTGCYNFWMFVMYFSLLFACFSTANRRSRMQYLIAFILTWAIGGNVIATLFSSAGPTYVQRLGLGDHFAPLMTILNTHAETAPLTVVRIQNILWDMYSAPQSLSVISAFPSMHVASTVLMALYAWAYNPRFGRVVAAFAGIIMLGSVLLAWHYAVDGYAGALIAVTCWWAVGRLLHRLEARSVC